MIQKKSFKSNVDIFFYVMIALFSFSLVNFAHAGDEVSLYNSKGNAVAYIDVEDDLTIYFWGGKPVAYIDDRDVYGFNGNHLGWFSDGAIINHDGDVPCVVKERHPGFTNFEEFKGFKEFKPFKAFKEFSPFKPFETNRFSSETCSLFLARGN